MKIRGFVLVVALAVASATFSEVVRPGFGGALVLPTSGIQFAPFLFTSGWTGAYGHDAYPTGQSGCKAFAIRVPRTTDREVRGKVAFEPSETAVSAKWSFSEGERGDLAFLGLMTMIPLTRYGGAVFMADGQRIRVPATFSGVSRLFSGDIREFEMRTADGAVVFHVNFPEKTHVLIQDDRAWNADDVSLRLSVEGDDLPMRLAVNGQVDWKPADPVRLVQGKDWIPLKAELDIEPGSALDFTDLCGRREPVGRYGRVVVRDGHFEFENQPGKPCRFYGVNIVGAANAPDPSLAKPFAVRLARMGYNTLRIHHHDDVLASREGDRTELDAEAMRRFDALAAACIENGIYLSTDLFVSRRVPWRGVGIDRGGEMDWSEFKAFVQFHTGTYQNLLRFAKNFLEHVNPHTGRCYADEPAIAWLSLVNEAPLTIVGEACKFKDVPGFLEKWRAWLSRKRHEVPAWKNLTDDLPDIRKASGDRARSPQETAFMQFLADSECEFARRVTRFLREQMKCRALTTNMNCGWYSSALQVPRATEYDYVDDHFYIDHPVFLGVPWRLPSSCPNENPLRGPERGVPKVAASRIFGKPFTISEYDYSGPGRFRGVGGIATAALASLQDWDGLWRFAWSHGEQGLRWIKQMNYFDLSGDPLACASERASVCLFLRRDACPLTEKCALFLPTSKVRSCTEALPDHSIPGLSPCAWSVQVGCEMREAASEDVRVIGTFPEAYAWPSERWNQELQNRASGRASVSVDAGTGKLILDTPCTAGGFAEEGRLLAGSFSANLFGGAATIWASSLDGRPLSSSSRLLVTHLTDVQNTDVTYADETLRVLLEWGKLPHLMRTGRADVTLAVRPGAWRVYALSLSGRRRGEVPCQVSRGCLSFVADVARDPSDATMLYELVCSSSGRIDR